jgi:ABC-type spermidine/putrescine transport system permease subunit II
VSSVRKRHPFSTAILVAVLIFFYAPILVVAVNALNKDDTLNSWGGVTLHWFRQIFADDRIRTDFGTSALIAAATTVLSVAIAVTTVLAARRLPHGSRTAFNMITYARLVLPEVVMTVGLFLLFRRLDIELGLVPVVIGHTLFCSAYATVVVQARYAAISGRFSEAAADLGAGPWRTFRRVTLPLLAPALVVAGLLSFTFSFDDVVSSVFLSGSSLETLPMLMMGMIRRQVTPEVNAIAVAVMAITLVVVALVVAATNVRAAAGARSSRDGATDEE